MLGVMLGGRLGHILIYDLAYYIAHPLKILAYHEGGMSFIGGIIGVMIAMWIFVFFVPSLSCRRGN
jgi:phosphatidylglycerol:prolipoprotein diacylglycerol transferase